MALTNLPGRTPLGAFYRSPLGVFDRGAADNIAIICFVSATEMHFATSNVNYYSFYSAPPPSGWGYWIADWNRWMSMPSHPVWTVVVTVRPFWASAYEEMPYKLSAYVATEVHHRNISGLGLYGDSANIDLIYDHLTGPYTWPTTSTPNYANYNFYKGFHNPTRTTPLQSMTEVKFFIENSTTGINRALLDPKITTLENQLTALGIPWSETIFTGTGVAGQQGRWLGWLCDYYGF